MEKLQTAPECPSPAVLYCALNDAMLEAAGMDDDLDIAIAYYFLTRAALIEIVDDPTFFPMTQELFAKACERLQKVDRHRNPLFQDSQHPEFIHAAETARSALYKFLYSGSAD